MSGSHLYIFWSISTCWVHISTLFWSISTCRVRISTFFGVSRHVGFTSLHFLEYLDMSGSHLHIILKYLDMLASHLHIFWNISTCQGAILSTYINYLTCRVLQTNKSCLVYRQLFKAR